MKGMNLYQKMKHSFLSGGAATIDVNCASMDGLKSEYHFLFWKKTKQIKITIMGWNYKLNKVGSLTFQILPDDIKNNDLHAILLKLKGQIEEQEKELAGEN
jgi:hypothetical protein